jgi:hypothetical protein
MLLLVRLFRAAIIAVGLASLAFILAPGYTEPFWNLAKTFSVVVGNDRLPSFAATQHWSALTLTTFVVGGIAYNLWRDRRHHILRAEYDCQTGATHLKEKVADLQAQLRSMTVERDKWQEYYLALVKKHTDALIASKEHEVRSEYGRCDTATLKELRKEFDALVQSKGHIEGFREAMQFFLAYISEPGKTPEVARDEPNGSPKDRLGKEKRPGLPCPLPPRT